MEIVTKTEWDGLREIRNQRVENIQIVLKSYDTLKQIYEKLKNATQTIAIKQSFQETFESGEIYLFCSRVNDKERGGDIDLYIVTKESNKVQKKIDFLVKLKERIGEQKIDVVLSYDPQRPIEQEAIKNKILL